LSRPPSTAAGRGRSIYRSGPSIWNASTATCAHVSRRMRPAASAGHRAERIVENRTGACRVLHRHADGGVPCANPGSDARMRSGGEVRLEMGRYVLGEDYVRAMRPANAATRCGRSARGWRRCTPLARSARSVRSVDVGGESPFGRSRCGSRSLQHHRPQRSHADG
jgi:hypothetical protein